MNKNDVNNNDTRRSERSPARPVVVKKKGTKRIKETANKSKPKIKKSKQVNVQVTSKDITNALVNMGQDEMDKFKELMGINDIIYNLQQNSQSVEQESTCSTDNDNQEVTNNGFDFLLTMSLTKDGLYQTGLVQTKRGKILMLNLLKW